MIGIPVTKKSEKKKDSKHAWKNACNQPNQESEIIKPKKCMISKSRSYNDSLDNLDAIGSSKYVADDSDPPVKKIYQDWVDLTATSKKKKGSNIINNSLRHFKTSKLSPVDLTPTSFFSFKTGKKS